MNIWSEEAILRNRDRVWASVDEPGLHGWRDAVPRNRPRVWASGDESGGDASIVLRSD